MNKIEFLKFLEFPLEWLEFKLYPDELFEIQIGEMQKDLSERGLESRFSEVKYGAGSEHYRYGAFCWVIGKMNHSVLDNLRVAVKKDPDTIMRNYMIKEINQLQKRQ